MVKSAQLSREVNSDEQERAIRELEVYGYSTIKNYLTATTTNKLLALTNANYLKLNQSAKVEYAGVPARDKDDKILYNLHNVDSIFVDILTTPLVRTIARQKLTDLYYRFLPSDLPNHVLTYYNARSSGLKLDLHIDSHIPFQGKFTNMMQFAFLLEDSNESNGCTVVVPGSHKSGEYTDREIEKKYPLAGKAGDLIFWDSRLWHGALENKSKQSRWALIATMGMWWMKPSMDIVRGMNDKIYKKCTNEQKQLLGFCSIPPINPIERNNTKCGYDFLKPSVKDYGF